jgi:hypothetical protein
MYDESIPRLSAGQAMSRPGGSECGILGITTTYLSARRGAAKSYRVLVIATASRQDGIQAAIDGGSNLGNVLD